MWAWVERAALFISTHILVLLVLPCTAENGSFWQQPKSLHSLAHLRQLMGWGAHRNAAVNCQQAAWPQKDLADYSSLVFKACQNTLQKYGWTQALHEGLINQRTNTQKDSIAKSIPATSNITLFLAAST